MEASDLAELADGLENDMEPAQTGNGSMGSQVEGCLLEMGTDISFLEMDFQALSQEHAAKAGHFELWIQRISHIAIGKELILHCKQSE
ncbi:hypothetical protein lerEdw1_017205 [Lerista edwardsae]|nr:hypothetical protein lerEdw1_017205 [Lerista edwardsae]